MLEFENIKRKRIIGIVIWLVFMAMIIILDYYLNRRIYLSVMVLGVASLFLGIRSLVISVNNSPYIKQGLVIILIFALILGMIILVPVCTHFAFFSKNAVSEEDLLSFYGSFITFAGALGLGLFLYYSEVKKTRDACRKKARIMFEQINDYMMSTIDFENFMKTQRLFTVSESWELDYYDIEQLIEYDSTSFKIELEIIFRTMKIINDAISRRDYENAKDILLSFEKAEHYSNCKYNYMDVQKILFDIYAGMKQEKPWCNRIYKELKKYSDKYFDIVNVLIENYMLINDINSIKLSDIEVEVVDQLLASPELNKWVSNPYEKRKVTEMVHMIAGKFNKCSKRLNYYWGECSFKTYDNSSKLV